MTKTTKLPTHCLDCGVALTRKNRASDQDSGWYSTEHKDVCVSCFDYWGWENTHSDEGHDTFNKDDACPVCHPELRKKDPEKAAKGPSTPTGRRNTSHADCSHERTPKARAKCRKERSLLPLDTEDDLPDDYGIL